MKQIHQQKENQVNEITSELKISKSYIIFEYLGLTGKALTKLRRDLHNINAKMYVAKNNVFSRALKNIGNNDFAEPFGPCALIIAKGDEIAPFKIIFELSKEFNFIKFKDGSLDNSHINTNQLEQIANIPSRSALYSMLLSCLQAPIRNFMYALKAIGETK